MALLFNYGAGGGIRTHVPREVNSFRDYRVTAASLLLRGGVGRRPVGCRVRTWLLYQSGGKKQGVNKALPGCNKKIWPLYGGPGCAILYTSITA